GGANAAGSREGHDDLAIGEIGYVMLETGGELCDFGNDDGENGGEGPDEFAADLSLGFARKTDRSGAQAGKQLGGCPSPAIAVLGKKGGQALLAEAGGAGRCRVSQQEGQRDRRVDVGEDGCGAGPEAIEQAAQAVGQSQPFGDEIVAGSGQRAQSLDLVGAGFERAEAVTVGAQNVGEHVGIAGVALAAGGTITRPTGFDDVGVN